MQNILEDKCHSYTLQNTKKQGCYPRGKKKPKEPCSQMKLDEILCHLYTCENWRSIDDIECNIVQELCVFRRYMLKYSGGTFIAPMAYFQMQRNEERKEGQMWNLKLFLNCE